MRGACHVRLRWCDCAGAGACVPCMWMAVLSGDAVLMCRLADTCLFEYAQSGCSASAPAFTSLHGLHPPVLQRCARLRSPPRGQCFVPRILPRLVASANVRMRLHIDDIVTKHMSCHIELPVTTHASALTRRG
jgi:hypothetical protein